MDFAGFYHETKSGCAMTRIDSFPTHEYEGIALRPGRALPFGATIVQGGVNFSVFSSHATSCKLALFHRGVDEPFAVIPFFPEFRIGHVFAMVVYDINVEETEYGYIFDGPDDARAGHRFDPTRVLLDPYAKIIAGREKWGEISGGDGGGETSDDEMSGGISGGGETSDGEMSGGISDGGGLAPYRSRILLDDYDWRGDYPLEIPMRDLVIYEMHVRGLTAHPSSGVKHPGTFTAVREKIPYFKELGINCVELLPVFEFDEFENWRNSPDGGTKLLNYWGYSTVGFFAPKAGLAASGQNGMQADEFKTLVRDLHRNGIEVILDVVFNHTAEGNEKGPYRSFRGIDNKTYYMLTPDGWYYNFSGCGNTLNCNNPVVRNMILDCLRYWAAEYHIDGFRFDLASILGRDQNGTPIENPPLLENLAFDPILGKCKLIAEAWDAGGLYQVGSFPSWGRWHEWNGKYRDDIRRFLKGDSGLTWLVSQYIQGSPQLYDPTLRGNCASVNFITCHDGFTMMDLYSYNAKLNFANGENNNDGTNDNHSWDCRISGSSEEDVAALRLKMVKNAMSILLLSHGIPMILAGDEFGNSQQGNNNAYCQDNEISWLDWDDLEKNRAIFDYVKKLIALRMSHDCLRSPAPGGRSDNNGGTRKMYPPISCHGAVPWGPDYSKHMLGILFCGDGDFIYMAMNMHWEGHHFQMPELPLGFSWEMYLASEEGAEYGGGDSIYAAPRSVTILVAG